MDANKHDADAFEDIVDALCVMSVDQSRALFIGIMDQVRDERKAGEQHLYPGIKVPENDKSRHIAAASWADAAIQWARTR